MRTTKTRATPAKNTQETHNIYLRSFFIALLNRPFFFSPASFSPSSVSATLLGAKESVEARELGLEKSEEMIEPVRERVVWFVARESVRMSSRSKMTGSVRTAFEAREGMMM